jgi:anti-sigma regulatory factor (Ser/Thr protein kinase)
LYGYAARGLTGDLTLSSDLTDAGLTIVLEDSGPPYDPRQRDLEDVEAQFDKPLEERGMGGLGVYFAVHGVDEFRYERTNDRNRNSFTVLRAAVASS